MDVSYLLEGLNDAQRDAVAAEQFGHQLVLAGAGSGKTKVLVQRIAWLVQVERISPYAIMAVTFTNKAAQEMRHRIEDLLNTSIQGMWVGTFHGLCHRLVKSHWKALGLQQDFQILDSDDQHRLIKRLTKELELDDARWPPKQTQWWINEKKEEGLRSRHIDPGDDAFQKTMHRVYREYEAACQRGGFIDFADLLLYAHELWLNHPEILAHYQQRLSHLLVDEFQDTNSIQYAWLRILAGDKLQLMAVGDDDQSIYGWRGAKIENLQNLSKDFNNTKLIRLEQNYRSTKTILRAANAVITNNSNRLGKELWTDGEDGDTIKLYAAYNEHDEARFVVDRIEQQALNNVSNSDMAILYRSNAQSRVLEEAMIRAQLPYRIYGGLRFYERMEIKNAISYMRLIANPNNDAAFERVVNTPTRGVGNKTLETLRAIAQRDGLSLWQATQQSLTQGAFPSRSTTALTLFSDIITTAASTLHDAELEDIAQYCVHDTGLMQFHKNEKGEKGLVRKENLEELIQACSDFEMDEDVSQNELQQFLDTASLDAGERQAEAYEDAVQLMTLHSAKGLEFNTVFLVGMEEGLFPHKMSIEDNSGVEEERRLCYVGITRAKVTLFLSYAEVRRVYGSENYNRPSRFLRELPNDCVEELRLGAGVTQALSQRGSSLAQSNNDTGFTLGQTVHHKKFGDGVILNFEGKGDNVRVEVNFAEGKKWLVLQYANLT
ncbi:MAG: DNA helicase II [Pseudomonadota bacterium]